MCKCLQGNTTEVCKIIYLEFSLLSCLFVAVKEIIERNIRLSAFVIYVLVALICCGGIIYFYGIKKEVGLRKKNSETYKSDLDQVSMLIHSVNDAQSEMNKFVVTGKRQHIRLYQVKVDEISRRVDSLKASRHSFHVDEILKQISPLLKEKKQSVILLNKQFLHHKAIDSLSDRITTLSLKVRKNAFDSAKQEVMASSSRSKKKNIFKRFANAVTNRSDAEEAAHAVAEISKDSNNVTARDTLLIDELVDETKQNYVRHIAAISSQVQSAVMADQFLSFRITELLMSLYNQIVDSRMGEIEKDGLTVDRNNARMLWMAGVALFLVLICTILIFINVSRGYKARLALQEANEENRRLLNSRHKLLLSVSHDVKTPLSSILGYAEVYKQKGKLSSDELLPIVRSGNHILALLNNLLEFSSLEKGSLSLIPHDFLLIDLSGELAEMFVPLAEKKSLDFHLIDNFESDMVLHSDYLKIKQILINVLSNSIKYTQTGSVSLETSYRNGELTFRVKDTGVGIPVEKRNLLFQPFVRIKENSANEDGSGFGLFVVKGLVELFGGKLDLRSELNKGTHVQVVLPVEMGEKQPGFVAKRILLVDDDELLLSVISEFCTSLGHAVTPCFDFVQFEQGIQALEDYDFVLTDMEMIHFSGEDVLAMVHQKELQKPVVLITGQTDLEKADILKKGFWDCLQKPVSMNALKSIIGGKVSPKTDHAPTFNIFDEVAQDGEPSILEGFLMATVENIILLRKSLSGKDFQSARFVAHKMLPTFLQLEAPEKITNVLQKIDKLRETSQFPLADDALWVELGEAIEEIEIYLEELQGKYLPH
ncbi:MAG: sensory transduction histidine kinase [Bacteroidetes bacterium]|nr:sensory transduction histidine kinase [Bacteroidota bacterium]